jgi:phage/plasmid-associated DNA primase
VEAFDSMFHIYCRKLNYETFNKKFQKRYKQFAELEKIRFAWMEEIDRSKLDVQALKDCIGAENIGGNEIMYGTSKDIRIYFKLMFISNNNPKFTNDNGMKRRGLCMVHTNRFVSQDVYDKSPDKTCLYVKDTKLKKLFKTEEYKLALFNILLPYAQRYYESKTLTNTDIFRTNWEDICCENDQMAQFLENNYIETKNKDDIIHKDVFLNEYQKYFNLNNISWNTILSDIHRLGINYDRMKKRTISIKNGNTETKKQLRGFIIGYKSNVIIITHPSNNGDVIIESKDTCEHDIDIDSDYDLSSGSEIIMTDLAIKNI